MNAAPSRILVVQPNWVGDAVMATPALRALRELYPDAQISYLLRRYVKPIYTGLPFADKLITYRTGRTDKKAGKGQFLELAARLRTRRFDMAILLSNSFRSALVCKMAGIRRIVGYDRDGRGFLLSDKLVPFKDRGKYVPSPIVKYYLGVVHYLGSNHRDLSLQLAVTPHERNEAAQILVRSGLAADLERPAATGRPPLVVLNPGAQYGSSKLWPARSFARLADKLIDQLGATILISSAPKERSIVTEILSSMRNSAIDLQNNGLTLGALKEIVRRCDLMITNDTGPRHIAAAFGVPVVTIFGPTHPEWTEIYFDKERKVSVPVPCGPCQLKKCPLDHRCMTSVTPDMVFTAACDLLKPHAVSA
ncbi:MAG: lipopolysaccharide heptosyltransferase II [Phycisphaerae bacterium]|nr:lipopolysaccharide heptosyltransferase II [Phycisphaerae bacterium]MDW8262164.1 lipopolysaccharide heptosyltransferase II [Phycisphaerales bacterium]